MLPQGMMSQNQLSAILAAWLAAVATAKFDIRLIKNNPTLVPQLDDTDWVIPTGSWYTAKTAVVPSQVYLDPTTSALKISFPSQEWDYTGTDPAETITGFYVYSNTDNCVCALVMLDTPKVMATTLDTLITEAIEITFPPIGF